MVSPLNLPKRDFFFRHNHLSREEGKVTLSLQNFTFIVQGPCGDLKEDLYESIKCRTIGVLGVNV